MTTILMTAYAVNPYLGSEEGTGWNLICQAARAHRVVAVTRRNNRPHIERYMQEQSGDAGLFRRMSFLYFDLPKWTIAWKKGPLLAALYFYIWQLSVALWLKRKSIAADVVHSVNFHSNWTPSFLWILGKPFVWGPVGNHALIPKRFILPVYGYKAYLKDRMLWVVKCAFWNLDPFLYITRRRAVRVFCVNAQSAEKLRLPVEKAVFMPAVATEPAAPASVDKGEGFTLISAGRFVPLKGFDLAIRSFARFYRGLPAEHQCRVKLRIIGKGPERARLQAMICAEGLDGVIELVAWMPRGEVIRMFSQAAAFLFPSHEGAGMVVAEALSFGLPVVCLDNYGPGAYVHPASALRTGGTDYAAVAGGLAARLDRLYHDAAFYNAERRLALERYDQLFRWDIKGDLLESAYRTAAAKASPVAAQTSIPGVYHA